MRRKIAVLWVYIGLAHGVWAQVALFEDPVNLGSGVNTAAEETKPVMLRNNNLLYFVRTGYEKNTGGKIAGKDIWFSLRGRNGTWGAASNGMGILNNSKDNEILGIGRRGLRLYLQNTYSNAGGERVMFSDFENGQWTEPLPLGIKVNSRQVLSDFYVHPEEEVLLFSMKYGSAKEDLYVCLKSDTTDWTAPIALGSIINTGGSEISPFLSMDKKVLYFSSNGHPGFGDMDIFSAERQDDTWKNWSKPVNLGKRVNSEAFDAYFMVNSDQEMYFASNRDGGLSDLYHSKLASQNMETDETEGYLTQRAKETDSTLAITMDKLSHVEARTNDIPKTVILHFGFDSFTPKKISNTALNGVLSYLKAQPQVDIEVIGHTDSTGPETYNQLLSLQRAEKIKQFFINRGIRGARIHVEGQGELYPYTSNANAKGRNLNRRVEIIFILSE